MNDEIGRRLIREAQNRHQAKVFVETGTAWGGTAEWATHSFDLVVTVEFVLGTHMTAVQNFWDKPQVKCLLGDSAYWMPHIAYMIREPAVYFLDAHYVDDGVENIAPTGVCPVMQELDPILRTGLEHVVLIDDARLFGQVVGYPSLSDIEQLATQHHYVVRQEGDMFIIERPA